MQNKIEFKVCDQGNNSAAYKECEAFIKKWQEILNIKDWEIRLEFLTTNEMNKTLGSTDYKAYCLRELNDKSAKICIDIEYSRANEDLELTILHEMLHIVTADYEWFAEECSDKGERTVKVLNLKLEQMVESLAKSFCTFIDKE